MPALVEATAPCRLELLEGGLRQAASEANVPLRLAIALDRRVWCRVERAEGGVVIHAKDTLQRVAAPDLAGIPETGGPVGRVTRALAAAGVHSSVRVSTQERVPEDAGLGTGAALSVALAAAVSPALDVAEVVRRAAAVESALGIETGESDLHAAAFGGAHVLMSRGGVTRLPVDPARVEECLLLVDLGQTSFRASTSPGVPETAAAELIEALRAGCYDGVAAILGTIHRARFAAAPSEVRTVVDSVARAGGAAWPCGRLLAVWAAPGARSDGPREAVEAGLQAAGLRSFPARVDLRGLEVE